METILIRILQLVMSLSLLVIIHEGGHFLFARLFKTRVEKFCLFFDPWLTLFKFKPKHSETEYAIGWLPLGGYVKIAGMIDESMDTEQMKQPPQPWEFRSKPAWQRLFIMVGGVLFNVILAFFIYSMILFHWGDQYIPVSQVPLGMDYSQTAKDIGFQDGDILLSADGKAFERMNTDLLTSIVEARQVSVLRNGEEASVYIPEHLMDRLLADSVRFATFRFPFVIDSLMVDSPARVAGLLPGDSITQLNGRNISFSDFQRHKSAMLSEGGTHELSLTYYRNGRADTVSLQSDSLYNIGVYCRTQTSLLLPVVDVNYSFFASLPAGITLGFNTLKGYVNQLKYVFSKEGVKQIGGFGTIANIFPAQWDWYRFWYMTAFISIMLAVMNILPIPALDGGHVLFLIYEIIVGRAPGEKFLERAQIVGMCLLIALMLWANLNDIIRYLF